MSDWSWMSQRFDGFSLFGLASVANLAANAGHASGSVIVPMPSTGIEPVTFACSTPWLRLSAR